MSKKEAHADIDKLSFEEALKELEEIVRKLESSTQDLDASINDYSRGNALKKHCETKLAEAKMKVEKITIAEDGKVETEALDVE